GEGRVQQRLQRAHAIGHVVGGVELRERRVDRLARLRFDPVAQCRVLQRAAPGGGRVRRIGGVVAESGPRLAPARIERARQAAAHRVSRGAQRRRVDHRQLLGDEALGGQREELLAKRRVERVVVEQRGDGRDQRYAACGGVGALEHGENARGDEALQRLPAVERVAVVCGEQRERGVVVVVFDDDRGREIARERGY